ncbi:ABC transporter ATP-binding protein [Streptomyces sp. NBC_01476]|uniref:ABC transporter ATP-binding protein n=1 Tax=Streptomyces sp. NBC_01476 TaxID=2903881 RepID=UPI002E31ED26|nr:ABC transporter ATP-binding protein [Streptomyces sp. NBC_01476]
MTGIGGPAPSPVTSRTPRADEPVIAFHAVGLTYPGPPAVAALRPCDLRVHRGEFVTVVGPSGSGKSTLLNVLGLLDAPTQGRYLLDGIDTGAVGDAQRAALRGRRIGFVFQSFHLLPHRSAQENVELAMVYQRLPRRERRDRAASVLGRVGLAHRLGSPPAQLSGGERQRVAIARALVSRPSLLLCDEPTGNLDSDTAASVLGVLRGLHADGMTLLVITHDAHVAAQGSRTLALHDGVLRERAAGQVTG